jgi:hypothetical protein
MFSGRGDKRERVIDSAKDTRRPDATDSLPCTDHSHETNTRKRGNAPTRKHVNAASRNAR